MGWLNGTDIERASATSVRWDTSRLVAPVTSGHVSLFWNRLAGAFGLPFNSSGQLVQGGWIGQVSELQPSSIVLVGLMEDVDVFGGIGQTVSAARSLVQQLGVPASSCILSPVPIWSNTAPSESEWEYWLSYGRNNGFTRWLLDVTPCNRLWLSSQPYSRFTSVSDYVQYISDTSALVKSFDADMECIASVYWDAGSDWGSDLLEQLLQIEEVDSIAVIGLMPISRSTTDPTTGCWAEARRFAQGALALKQMAPDRVRTVIALSPAVASDTDPPYHTPEYERRNGNAFGALWRALSSAYLIESGGFRLIAHWLQPATGSVAGHESTGVMYCGADGALSVSGQWLQWLSRCRGSVPCAEGTAVWLDRQDGVGNMQSGPGSAILGVFGSDRIAVLVAQVQGTEPIQMDWFSYTASGAQVYELPEADVSGDAMAAPQLLTAVSLLPGSLRFAPSSGSSILMAELMVNDTATGSSIHLDIQQVQQQILQRVDGVGDIQDLLVRAQLYHPSWYHGGTRLYFDVHAGEFYLSGRRQFFSVQPRMYPVQLPAGRSETTLPYEVSLRHPPSLVDNRGEFLLVCNPVRLCRRIDMQYDEAQGLWYGDVPGGVLQVRHQETLESLYPVQAERQVTEHSYWVSESGRRIATRHTDIVVDYLADTPDIAVEEIVWCEDGSTLLTRRIPYLPSVYAKQVSTGRVYVPNSIVNGRLHFDAGVPPGAYLVSYLVDRSFLVYRDRLIAFTAQPASARLTASQSDADWEERLLYLNVPSELDPMRFIYLWDDGNPPAPGGVARLVLYGNSVMTVSERSYHVLLLALDERDMPVPDAAVRLYPLQAGTAQVEPVSGRWVTDTGGRLLLRVTPVGTEARFRLECDSGASTVLVVPPRAGAIPALAYCEHYRLNGSEDYDICLLRPVLPGEMGQMQVQVSAISGWVCQHSESTETVRRSRVELNLPGEPDSAGMLSPVGWCVLRVPAYPVQLEVTVSRGGQQVHICAGGIAVSDGVNIDRYVSAGAVDTAGAGWCGWHTAGAAWTRIGERR